MPTSTAGGSSPQTSPSSIMALVPVESEDSLAATNPVPVDDPPPPPPPPPLPPPPPVSATATAAAPTPGSAISASAAPKTFAGQGEQFAAWARDESTPHPLEATAGDVGSSAGASSTKHNAATDLSEGEWGFSLGDTSDSDREGTSIDRGDAHAGGGVEQEQGWPQSGGGDDGGGDGLNAVASTTAVVDEPLESTGYFRLASAVSFNNTPAGVGTPPATPGRNGAGRGRQARAGTEGRGGAGADGEGNLLDSIGTFAQVSYCYGPRCIVRSSAWCGGGGGRATAH